MRVKRILLIESYVAGLFLADRQIVVDLAAGQVLRMKTEPEGNGVLSPRGLYAANGKRVGFIPRSDTPMIIRLMDAGETVEAVVSEITVHGSRVTAELHLFLMRPPRPAPPVDKPSFADLERIASGLLRAQREREQDTR